MFQKSPQLFTNVEGYTILRVGAVVVAFCLWRNDFMEIYIKNAHANNLKNISVKLPLGKIIGVSGVSGSGKSTLVKDIISAYGVQDYMLSLSMFQRSLISDAHVVPVDQIDNLPVTILIDVVNSITNPNSTLSTVTGIHTLLRMLYSKYGKYTCPNCGCKISNEIFEVLDTIPHRLFAEIKYDAQYNEKINSIKTNFIVEERQYFSADNVQQPRKTKDGYARIFFKSNFISDKKNAQVLKRCANTSLRILLNDNIIADTRIHTLCPSCNCVVPRKSMSLFSFNILAQDGGGACPVCMGTGRVLTCKSENFIQNDLPMNKGGIPTITAKGIRYTTITEKFLDVLASKYHFSWDSTFQELTEPQKKIILNGTQEEIEYTDRKGANGGKKSEVFKGFITYTIESYSSGKGQAVLEKYIDNTLCPNCNGMRLNPLTDSILYRNIPLKKVLSMNLHELGQTILSWSQSASDQEKIILKKIHESIKLYGKVGCDYLELNRQSSTLSGGELQRLRLCTFLSSDIVNSCILLDEPTTGLHPKDINQLLSLLYELQHKGHTIVLIEHNRQILSKCDYIIELGPKGGDAGGKLQFHGDSVEYKNTVKQVDYFHKAIRNDAFVLNNQETSWINMNDFSALYIKHQSVHIPQNSLVSICGVSGSGKTTFVNQCFSPYILQNAKKLSITKIENLGQKNSVRSTVSNVGSLLNINEKVAQLFAGHTSFSKSCFMVNSQEGKCPMCRGRGKIVSDNTEELCPVCEGKMFSPEILSVSYENKNILQYLQTPIDQLVSVPCEDKKLNNIYKCCLKMGIGYLTLLRTSKSLSKGELQRVKLVDALSNVSSRNVYILDEPSKGLHPDDLQRLLDVIHEITARGNLVVAVEHNLDFLLQSDYIVEFGPSSGKNGGKVVFQGNIKDLLKSNTPTCVAIKDILSQKIEASTEKQMQENIDRQKIVLNGINARRNQINFLDLSSQDMQELFEYTNREYLTTLLPSSGFLFGNNVTENYKIQRNTLPVIRPVDLSNTTYGRKARIVDTLSLYAVISKIYSYFYKLENPDLSVSLEVFSPGNSVGKCTTCKGKGEVEKFNFDLAFDNGILCKDVIQLLRNRTNYAIAKKHLKSDYGLDISKPLDQLTCEEKRVLLFGDKSYTFFEKDKEYYWEGINRLITKELKYMSNEELSEQIRLSKSVASCPVCSGELLKSKYQLKSNKSTFISYSDLMKINFSELTTILSSNDPLFSAIHNAASIMSDFGLGGKSLFTKMSSMSLKEQSIVQLVSYLVHPIQDSIIMLPIQLFNDYKDNIHRYLQSATLHSTIIITTKEDAK